ncbi:MAG: iron transporter [Planctomycetes bacterium]|nr:iron transporter [Planctomycetota bacterium]MCD7896873.1 iron transporter [Planctomycetaceae bacterium]
MDSVLRKLGLAAALVVFGLAIVAPQAHAAAPAPSAETAGFEEFPVGDDHEVFPLNIAGVYFQPVDMDPAGLGGLAAADADMHMEADISALEGNNLGYGAGDFVPYLTVRYKAVKEGGKTIEGTFMPMSASDGPHYGNNVKLDGPGRYKITFIIENPSKQSYLLHIDKETGVTGRYWEKPIEVSWDFDYIPRVW